MTLTIILNAILIIMASACINRIRGGLFGSILPKGRGDDVAGLFYGCLAFIVIQQPWALLAFGVAFRLGEAHGWGHWQTVAVGNKEEGRTDESPIDDLLDHIMDLDRWAFWGLTLRGMLWGVCLAVPAAFISWIYAVAFVAAGAALGAVFFATRYMPTNYNQRWANGEYMMGAVWGMPLVAVYLASV